MPFIEHCRQSGLLAALVCVALTGVPRAQELGPQRASVEAMAEAAQRAAEIAESVQPRGYNPAERITVLKPNLEGRIERPLRYQPDGLDFVIVNGDGLFNRPLYGRNTQFRVDAGDRPEFVLYLRGRGGNLRLGVRTAKGAKWLTDAETIEARYRPGSMVYTINDPLLGGASLRVTGMSMYETDGLIVQVELFGSARDGLELLWAYGGVNGERSSRGGDIGTEGMPLAEYFHLRPEYCNGNRFEIGERSFTLRSGAADVHGIVPAGATMKIADASQWDEGPAALLASDGAASQSPLVVGHAPLASGAPVYLALQRLARADQSLDYELAPAFEPDVLAELFSETENTRVQRALRVNVRTPDPFIDAAVAAINIGVDAVWDEPTGTVMHGAVAWRSRLLGWRGGYSPDAFGWHDRARRHFSYWPTQMRDTPDPAEMPPHDPEAHLARNEPGLCTTGAMSFNHYDMNAVFIDALFRHLMWTGDLEFAHEVWPTIEKHLAWERRLFRRPFGERGGDPLYEAYAMIWASDDLQYNGGGVTHASAFNYYHNLMAARLARLIGEDPSLYEDEAERILLAMRRHLWLPDEGWYAEYRDILGLGLVHPSAAAWTVYHAVDSEALDARQAAQLMRYADTHLPHLPVQGPGVPRGDWFTIASTDWMPYSYSINNVVVAEAGHTALAYWQTGRAETAFQLFKGVVLDNMFMGSCPGNLGMTTALDAARGEAQRDFADAAGVMARAVVEGLFGVVPHRLQERVTIRPGFPSAWSQASMQHPDFDFEMRREGMVDHWSFTHHFGEPLTLRFELPARGTRITAIDAHGARVDWRVDEDRVGRPVVIIEAPRAHGLQLTVTWGGAAPAQPRNPEAVAYGEPLVATFGAAEVLAVDDPQRAFDDVEITTNRLTATVNGAIGHRTVFAQLAQDDLKWWQPVHFEIKPPYELIAQPSQRAGELLWRVRNNTDRPLQLHGPILIDGEPREVALDLAPQSDAVILSAETDGLLPGTHRVEIITGEGRAISGNVVNWQIAAMPPDARMESIALEALYNDRVDRIFRNAYLSPRSPYVSLALPVQGIGSWAHYDKTFTVEDRGLREAAAGDGIYRMPNGVSFRIPTGAGEPNIAFVSRYDNFPDEMTFGLSGEARHLYLLMAGSTNWMQSRIDNGEVIVRYADATQERLPLHNPTTWWPIDQDYFIDDYAFRRPEPIPPRIDLATGETRILTVENFKGRGGTVPGGAATVLDLPLDRERKLESVTIRALANEVVIGLMAATLVR